MKTYMIVVNFYSGETFLYLRKFLITAKNEQEARVFVSNPLSILEFSNYKIMEVRALCE